MDTIYFFKRDSPYYFLSYYYNSNFVIYGQKYISVEQYFQSQKFYQPEDNDSME